MNGSPLAFPAELGALGAALGILVAIVSSGGDARKLAQVGGMTAAGIGLGMALNPDGGTEEAWAGGAIAAGGVLAAICVGRCWS
jgi:hypothetical protein